MNASPFSVALTPKAHHLEHSRNTLTPIFMKSLEKTIKTKVVQTKEATVVEIKPMVRKHNLYNGPKQHRDHTPVKPIKVENKSPIIQKIRQGAVIQPRSNAGSRLMD